MSWDLNQVFKTLIKSCFSILLGIFLVFHPFGLSIEAASQKPSMSGDFVKDTVSVAQSLKETISISENEEHLSDAKDEALGAAATSKEDSMDKVGASIDYVIASGVTGTVGYTSADAKDEGIDKDTNSGTAWYVGATVSF